MRSAHHLQWRTSSYTGNGANCVDIAFTSDCVLMRDTKQHGHGPEVSFSREQWARFLAEVLDGLPSDNGAVVVREDVADTFRTETRTSLRWCVREISTGTELHFTEGEWEAFRLGVADGEFDVSEEIAFALG